jgi:hypothetical protein
MTARRFAVARCPGVALAAVLLIAACWRGGVV